MSLRKTFEQFTREAEAVHGSRFTYPDGVYITALTKIKVICNVCGNASMQKPIEHLKAKCGCPTCSKGQAQSKIRKSFDSFLEKATRIHGSKYEFIKDYYKDRRSIIPIYCTRCDNVFFSKAYYILNGNGCSGCSEKAVDSDKLGRVYQITYMGTPIKYVGITTTSLHIRLTRHIDASLYKGSTSPLHTYIRDNNFRGFGIVLLEEAPAIQLEQLEEKWMNLLNTKAPIGFNKNKAGAGIVIKAPLSNGKKYAAIIEEIDTLTETINRLRSL